MFDFEEWSKKQTDKIFLYFNVDTDQIYSTRFKKVIRFIGYRLNPAILSIASFIIMIWVFNKIYVRAGMDKLIIVFMVILIFTLRGISSGIKKLTE